MKTRALVLLLCLAALGAAPAEARPLDELRRLGQVRIAVYRDFPPFSTGSREAPAGIDVDLARALAERLQLSLDIMLLTADENVDDDLRNGVWKGSKINDERPADVMLHVPYDRELDLRNEMVVLVAPYYRDSLVVARRAATPTLGVFTEEKVGVEVDSISDLYLSGSFGGRLRNNTRRFPTLSAAAAALRAGEVQALMGPRSEIEAALGQDRGGWVLSTPATPGLMRAAWPLGMAVKENSRDLGYALEDIIAEMIADGTLPAIFTRHGTTYTAPGAE